MKVLGIETASERMGVALLDRGETLAVHQVQKDTAHSDTLMPLIHRVLTDSDCPIHEVGGIALSTGPGSFTGLRVGVSTVKGLVFALKIPVVAVSTLEALSASVTTPEIQESVCPVMDARRGEVYTALFQTCLGKDPARLLPDAVMPWEEMVQQMSRRTERMVFAGSGAIQYGKEIRKAMDPGPVFAGLEEAFPSPVMVARLGGRRLGQGQDDASRIAPVYLSRLTPRTPAPGGVGTPGR